MRESCVLFLVLFCHSRILIERFSFASLPCFCPRRLPSFGFSFFSFFLFLNLLRALSPCRNFPRRDIHSRSRSVSAFSLAFIWNWNEIETSIRSQSDLGHTPSVSFLSPNRTLPTYATGSNPSFSGSPTEQAPIEEISLVRDEVKCSFANSSTAGDGIPWSFFLYSLHPNLFYQKLT